MNKLSNDRVSVLKKEFLSRTISCNSGKLEIMRVEILWHELWIEYKNWIVGKHEIRREISTWSCVMRDVVTLVQWVSFTLYISFSSMIIKGLSSWKSSATCRM